MMGKIVFESPTSPSFFGEQPQWLQYIPYNSSNKQRAKENRKPMTNAETKMRFGVLKERPLGYKFIRQKMINSFIIDFYCAKLLLGIEIDGSSHDTRKRYDDMRTKKIGKSGIKIIRYKNEDVFYSLNRVSQDVVEELNIRVNELGLSNHPSASADTSSLVREVSRKKALS